MNGVKELLGSKYQLYDNLINEALFRVRCCIPGIIQSYNQAQNTVEVQPAIRERVVDEKGNVSYQQLPLLINVPVVFPTASNIGITFPLAKNDQCLVLFSDLAIDNFWEKGVVQNPVEIRRHDLSDGMAIPCNLSIGRVTAPGETLNIVNGETKIEMSGSEISFSGPFGSFTATDLVKLINQHYHIVETSLGTYSTSTPRGV